MKMHVKLLIAFFCSLLVIVACIVGGIPELAAFFVILAVLLLLVWTNEYSMYRQVQARKG